MSFVYILAAILIFGVLIAVHELCLLYTSFTEGVSVPYIHAGGKIGVLVNLKVEGDIDATAVGKDVAMQIAALNPRFWDKSQVSQDVLDEEKKIMMVQMENCLLYTSGKQGEQMDEAAEAPAAE